MDIPLSPGVIGVICAQPKKEIISFVSLKNYIRKFCEKTKINDI